ncbi:hypothetical protein M0813_28356 [Anaeramoeba flamelloides]|uniref:PAS domain-containing protein n=1 Tax=Anaeramoeba flamelloides TaxID=1746091 RepID=A0ABQ8XT50_9EUKA|nr:hypothetical protein M0813_28356 [Anaeramoeba flamelloides]
MGQKQSKGSISEFNIIKKKDCKLYTQVIRAMNDPACIIGPHFRIKTINRSFLNRLGILDQATFKNKTIKSIFTKFPNFLPKFQPYFGLTSLVSVMKILEELGNHGSNEFYWEMKNINQEKVFFKVKMSVILFGGKSSLQLIAHELSYKEFTNKIDVMQDSSSSELEYISNISFGCGSEFESDKDKKTNNQAKTKPSTKMQKKKQKKKTKKTTKTNKTKKCKRKNFQIAKSRFSELCQTNTDFELSTTTEETYSLEFSSFSSETCSGLSISEKENYVLFSKNNSPIKKTEVVKTQSKIYDNHSETSKEHQTNSTSSLSSVSVSVSVSDSNSSLSSSEFLKTVEKEFESVGVY